MKSRWTPEAEAELSQMWRSGVLLAQIKAHFGVGYDSVMAACKRLGLTRRSTAGFWTPEREALAKRLYIDEGRSAGEAARAVGAPSRNAVIGIAHRRGWMVQGRKPASAPHTRIRAKAPAVPRDRTWAPKPGPQNVPGAVFGKVSVLSTAETAKKRAASETQGRKLVDSFAAPANDDAILLIERGRYQCSWPVGEPDRPANQLCCGQPVADGANPSVETYCARHAERAVARVLVGGAPNAKAYEKSLRRFVA